MDKGSVAPTEPFLGLLNVYLLVKMTVVCYFTGTGPMLYFTRDNKSFGFYRVKSERNRMIPELYTLGSNLDRDVEHLNFECCRIFTFVILIVLIGTSNLC
jgi:hypothetical protein